MSRRHSGFAHFPSDGQRDQFVRAVLGPDAHLRDRAFISGSRPTIVFDDLTTGERRRVVAALKGLGQWFDDVQFETKG
jgi:hypothetical protein